MASSPSTTTTQSGDNKTVVGYPVHPAQTSASYTPPAPPPISGNAYVTRPRPPTTSFSVTNRHSTIPTDHNQQEEPTLLTQFIAVPIFFVLVCAVLFLLFYFNPKVPDIGVNSALLSLLNTTRSDSLSTNWGIIDMSIIFFVKNPNDKFSVSYDRVVAQILYGDEEYLLATTQLPKFHQNKLNETALRARFAVGVESVDADVLVRIMRERETGSVSFNVKVLGKLMIHEGIFGTEKQLMRVDCKTVTFGFSPQDGSGTLLGGPRECTVAEVSKYSIKF